MGIDIAVRIVTGATLNGHPAALIAAAAATESDSTVKAAIITGGFAVAVALISAGALLFRHSATPDVSELLDVHERVAVMETNQADMREDMREIRAILRRQDRDR